MRDLSTILGAAAVSLGMTITIEEDRYRPLPRKATPRQVVVDGMFNGAPKPVGYSYTEKPKGKRAKRRAAGKARIAPQALTDTIHRIAKGR